MENDRNIDYFIAQAKEIISKCNLRIYIEILFNYWASQPPTLGHGFAHVIKVAVNSYLLGVENNYPNPEHLFVGGLFHDIYRPAHGQDGEEDQTKGAQIVSKLFNENNIDQDLTKKVIAMIETHDNWRGQDNPPIFDLLVSLGDKWAHDVYCVYSYVWSSNQFLAQNNKPIIDNHLRVLFTFVKYQQRAWEIFYKYRNNIKGIENPIQSYLSAYQIFTNNYLNNKNFLEELNRYASNYANMEEQVLASFFEDNEKISSILSDGLPLRN